MKATGAAKASAKTRESKGGNDAVDKSDGKLKCKVYEEELRKLHVELVTRFRTASVASSIPSR